MPKVSIFIRTYRRDVVWLDFCLQSIHANLKGWDEIVVAIPEGQESHLRYLGSERRVSTPRFREDYVGQQSAKLQAHRHVRGDYVLFVDSDVVFQPGTDVAEFFDGGRPILGKWRYASMVAAGERGARWRFAVERLFGEMPEWEYMRGNGARLYHVDTLRRLEQRFPDLEAYARTCRRKDFSEFNILGYFAERTEPERYVFRDVEVEALPPQRSRQFWTVDGVTPETLRELAAMGFHPRWPSTLSPWDKFRAWLSQTTRRVKRRLKGEAH